MPPRKDRLRPSFPFALLPDPCGALGLAVVLGVLLTHALRSTESGAVAGPGSAATAALLHLWLVCGPPLGLYLGARSLRAGRAGSCVFLSAALGAFLTLVTGTGLVAAFLSN